MDINALIADHAPLLVLYPEIAPGTARSVDPDYPHVSPLRYDYHPRDIRIVLEHANFQGRKLWFSPKGTFEWQEMLDRMESEGYERNLKVFPGVHRNDRDGFWAGYATAVGEKEYPRACYAWVARGKGINEQRFLVQYWYAYLYNDFWNTHEMDWETAMIVFKETPEGPQPRICAYSAHLGGHWLPWPEVEKATGDGTWSEEGTHPVVYVANGSHANYFYGPALYATAPPLVSMAAKLKKSSRPLVDYTMSWDDGSRHTVEPKVIPEPVNDLWSGEWRWLNLRARWGSPGQFLDLQFGDDAPLGPPRAGDRWSFPFRWIVTQCSRAPTRDETRVPTLWEPGWRPGPR